VQAALYLDISANALQIPLAPPHLRKAPENLDMWGFSAHPVQVDSTVRVGSGASERPPALRTGCDYWELRLRVTCTPSLEGQDVLFRTCQIRKHHKLRQPYELLIPREPKEGSSFRKSATRYLTHGGHNTTKAPSRGALNVHTATHTKARKETRRRHCNSYST
jgi:hypothetical protein